MATGRADERMRPAGEPVLDHEADHARLIALEGERDEIVERGDAARIVERTAGRSAGITVPRGLREALLELAHRGEVLVELLLVAAPQLLLQILRVVLHPVEHARERLATDLLLLLGRALVHTAEELVERGERVDHRRERELGTRPRDRLRVAARRSEVARHRLAGAPLQRREARGGRERGDHCLIQRDVAVQSPVGIRRAVQHRAGAERMIAGAGAQQRGGVVEARDRDDLRLQRSQWRERGGQRERGARLGRYPRAGVAAVGHEVDQQSLGGGIGLRARPGGREQLEAGQRHHRAGRTEQEPAPSHHCTSRGRMRNAGEIATSSIS